MDPAVVYFKSDRPASKSAFCVKWINTLAVVDITILTWIITVTYVLQITSCSTITTLVDHMQVQAG
jgi:hypothetical protein